MEEHGGEWKGEELYYRCITHDEQRPSASWNPKTNEWHCFPCDTGGWTNSLARKLGIETQAAAAGTSEWVVEATYTYESDSGKPLYRKLRYSVGKVKYSWQHPDGTGQWVKGRGNGPIIPYRLPQLIASSGRIWICEGEKDAENGAKLGLTTTSALNGATASANQTAKWHAELTPWFRGRDVVIVPDLDRDGLGFAQEINRQIGSVAKSVRILQLPGEVTPDHGYDLSDWIGDGGTVTELEQMADALVPMEMAEPITVPGVYRRSDVGNGELFARMHGADVRYDWQAGRWLEWKTGRWRSDVEGSMYQRAKETARERIRLAADIDDVEERQRQMAFSLSSESIGRVEGMIKQARSEAPISDSGLGWDENPMLIGGERDLANLAIGRIRPGTQEDRITLSTGYVFDPEATCPRWEQFLMEVFGDNAELLNFIQRAVGYSLTGSAKEQIWFLLFGGGSNGKSTFVDTLFALLGQYAADTPAATLMARTGISDGSSATPDLAALRGKRFVICTETEELGKLNAARLKMMVGDNPITARALHQSPMTFRVTFKLWMTTNALPRTDDDSDGFWRRVRLIPFNRKFEGANRDNDLEAKLKAELPGIFNWALRGAMKWSKDGLQTPDSVMLATNQFRVTADPMTEWMGEEILLHPIFKTASNVLFDNYLQWGRGQGIQEKELLSSSSFGRRMAARFERRKIVGINYYIGLRPKTKEEKDEARAASEAEENPPQNEGFREGLRHREIEF